MVPRNNRASRWVALVVGLCVLGAAGSVAVGAGVNASHGRTVRRVVPGWLRQRDARDLARRGRAAERSRASASARERARVKWWHSRSAEAQRRGSQTRFHGLGAAASQALAERVYSREFTAAAVNPASHLRGKVLHYQSSYRATVRVHGRVETVLSSVPLRTTGSAPRPVDIRLRPSGSGFSPVAAAVPVTLPARLGAGIVMASSGVRLVPDGADVAGSLVAGRRVFYANARQDTDVVLTPAVTGAELFWILRSRLSPERLSYRLDLPAGAHAVQRSGGVVVLAQRRLLARIPFPIAYDAQGQTVPLTLRLVGSRVVIEVPHRRMDVAYPLAVDPASVQGGSMTGWSAVTQGSTAFTSSTNCTSGCALIGGAAEVDAPAGTVTKGDHAALMWSVANLSTPGVIDHGEFDTIKVQPDHVAGYAPGYDAAYQGEIQASCGTPPFGPTGYGFSDYLGNVATWSSFDTVDSPPAYNFAFTGATQNCVADTVTVALVSMESGLATGSSYIAAQAIVLYVIQNGATKQELFGSSNAAEQHVVRACAGKPVNCATGNQFETQTDISVPSHRLQLGLVRTYNSQAAAVASGHGPFGYGWSSLPDDHLVIDQTNSVATVYQADGSSVPFTINADGSFSTPGPWVEATLVKRSDGSYLYTLPDRTTITFDPSGRLLSLGDRNHNQITAGYDGAGHLSTLTDASGRAITLSYNADGTVRSASDPAGHTVAYAYDGSGNLTQVTDLAGGVWRFGYDASHELTSMVDPNGGSTTTAYDSSQRVVSQTDALHRTRTWAYSQWGPGELETMITNPGGDITDERFNHANEPVQITHAQGTSVAGTRTFSYDANNLVTAITDENGHTTHYTYDSSGNRTSRTDANSHTASWGFDSSRDVTSITTPSGHVTTISYDATGNPISVSRPVSETGQTQSTTFTYTAAGDLSSQTDPRGKTWSYGYDSYGDQTSATSPAGHKSTWSYDVNGNVATSVSADGNEAGATPSQYTTTYTRDALGRATDIKDPLGHHTVLVYDPNANLTSVTDRDGRQTQYTHDAENQLTKLTRPDGSTQKTGYDADGQMISQTDGNNHATSYQRDARERVTAISDPLNRTRTMAYDAAGNLTSLVDESNRTSSYGYDSANELTSVSYSSGTPGGRSFSYDADGNPTQANGDTVTYDSLDRLASSANQYGQTTTYTYDLANEITKIAYPQTIVPAATTSTLVKQNTGAVTHAFDPDGNLTTITDWLGDTSTFSYDAEGQLAGQQLADGSHATYTLDHNGAITAISDQSPNNYSFTATYTRTAEGLLSGTNESQNTGGSNYSYTYDQNGRLKTATTQGALTTPTPYAYDSADNLTSQPNTTGSLTQGYDAASQLTSATDSLTAAKQTYTYDPLGERTGQTDSTTGNLQTYSYDQVGQLTSYISAAQNRANRQAGTSTPTATYGYDATGLRNDHYVNQLHNIAAWDRTAGVPRQLTDATTSYIYGPDGLPLEQIDATSTVHYYHHDQLGSTRALTDKNGRSTSTDTYDAYGNLQGTSASVAATTNPFLYAGQYTDPETSLQYDRARYYDSNTGQFLTRDPLGALTRQPYSYAGDSPLNATDPTGRDVIDTLTGAVPQLAEDAGAGVGCVFQPEVCGIYLLGSTFLNTASNAYQAYQASRRGCGTGTYERSGLLDIGGLFIGVAVSGPLGEAANALEKIGGGKAAGHLLNGLGSGSTLAANGLNDLQNSGGCGC